MSDKQFEDISGILCGSQIDRVEVLDNSGRAYIRHDVGGVEFLVQDDGRTLKIRVKDQSE